VVVGSKNVEVFYFVIYKVLQKKILPQFDIHLRWSWYMSIIGETRKAYRILVEKLHGEREFGKLIRRWEININMRVLFV